MGLHQRVVTQTLRQAVHIYDMRSGLLYKTWIIISVLDMHGFKFSVENQLNDWFADDLHSAVLFCEYCRNIFHACTVFFLYLQLFWILALVTQQDNALPSGFLRVSGAKS